MTGANAKIWLEVKGKPLLGEGRAHLLREIAGGLSLNAAAKKLEMSYRHAWGIIKEMEKISGKKIVDATRGGATGGGTKLTEYGRSILRQYDDRRKALENLMRDDFWEAVGLKLSARNQLKGTVKEVVADGVVAKVKIHIDAPMEITAVVTKEAVEELGVKKGDKITAIVKSTEIMLGKE
jgi:molybdate transport system regulatory protein